MECSVCHETFRQPKLLPCSHLFCRGCLVSWFESSNQAECPLCRTSVAPAEKREGQSAEELVDSLPDDLSMAAVVESAIILGGPHFCCVCDGVAAEAMCMHCGDMFCPQCSRAHQKMSMSRHHELKDLASLTPEIHAASRPPVCPAHPDKTPELFCCAHGEPMCNVCFVSKHRSCKDVFDFMEKKNEARSLLNTLDSYLTALDTSYEKASVRAEQILLNSEDSLNVSFTEIDNTCNLLQGSVEDRRQRLKDLVLESAEKVKSSMQETKVELGPKRRVVRSNLLLLKRVQETTPSTALFPMATMLRERFKEMNIHTFTPPDLETVKVMKLKINFLVATRLHQEINNLGEMVVEGEQEEEMTAEDHLSFHRKCGKRIELTNEQRTARRQGKTTNGIVLSKDIIKLNKLHEVKVEKINVRWNGNMQIGVTWLDPGKVTVLPPTSELLPDSVIIGCDHVWTCGKLNRSNYGSSLKVLQEGSRVGVLIDAERHLRMYVDGEDQGIVAPDIPMPCWAVFDVCGTCEKITALPTKDVQCVVL